MYLFVLVLVLFQVIASASASCLHGTEFYRSSLGKRDGAAAFGYTDRLSALNWANLDPSYAAAACAESKFQSPINLDNTTSIITEPVQCEVSLTNTITLLNLGFTLKIIANGTTTFQNEIFALAQYHFHTPSEHRINEEYFPMEMHMVFQNAGTSGLLRLLMS